MILSHKVVYPARDTSRQGHTPLFINSICEGKQALEKNFGLAGLEPATPCPPDMYANQLRYSPIYCIILQTDVIVKLQGDTADVIHK